MDELQELIEQLVKDLENKKVDKNFRLFLTTMPTADFPRDILQGSIKLIQDPPLGVKANMLQVYQAEKGTYQKKKLIKGSPEYLKEENFKLLFMSLSYFHSVIRERRRYGPIGWNILYDFNASDLLISKR